MQDAAGICCSTTRRQKDRWHTNPVDIGISLICWSRETGFSMPWHFINFNLLITRTAEYNLHGGITSLVVRGHNKLQLRLFEFCDDLFSRISLRAWPTIHTKPFLTIPRQTTTSATSHYILLPQDFKHHALFCYHRRHLRCHLWLYLRYEHGNISWFTYRLTYKT